MKITFLITFLYFLNSSVSYSKTITLKNCYLDLDKDNYEVYGYEEKYILPKKFDTNLYEEFKFDIDTVEKKIKKTVIYTDTYLKKIRDYEKKKRERYTEYEKKTGEKLIYPNRNPKKIEINTFPITILEKKYIVSEKKSDILDIIITVNLDKKKINTLTISHNRDLIKTDSSLDVYCK